MKNKICFTVLLTLFIAIYTNGQDLFVKDGYCSYTGDKMSSDPVYTFSSDDEANSAVERILKYTGLKQNFLIKAANVSNAMAAVKGSTRYILYNQEFMMRVKAVTNTDWGAISIMAHEIGHHLQGHTLLQGGSTPKLELEADKYSGFILQKMGATLEEAKAALTSIGNDQGSSTHPGRQARLTAIANGWIEARDLAQPSQSVSKGGTETNRNSESNNVVKDQPNNYPQNLKTANTLIVLGKMDEAKVEIDKAIKNPKLQTKAETWFLQYKIYGSLVKTPNGKIDIAQAASISDAAFEKYISMEKDMTLLKENNGSTPIFEMYSTFNATAVNAYNNKKYDSAGYYFSKAVDYIDKIVKYKWSSDTKLAFDTISILYAGVAYENAKKTNEAVKYYARLVEAKVGGKDYIGLYRYLLLNAVDNKNEANFKKYLAFSKEMYPNENWEVYELEFFSKALSLQEKTAKYELDDASGNLSSLQYAYYGEAFANASKEPNFDSSKLDFYKSKAIQAFKKASDKKPEDGLAAYNVGVLSYNQFIELDEKRRENTRKLQALNANRVVEKDPKKKAASDAAFKTTNDELKKSNADLEAPTNEYVQVSLTYLENAFKILKDKKDKTHQEKNCLGRSVDFLSNLYAYKRDKARGKDPKAYDAFEAKYKFYDELHGKF